MFIFEHRHEREGQNHGVTSENQPYGLPVGNAVLGVHLNHFTAHDAAKDTAEAVSHHQEHPLRTGANCRANFFFDKHRTRDVEEVECATVNDHRQYQQYSTERSRVAVSKQRKTQDPRHNTDHHYVLNTVAA